MANELPTLSAALRTDFGKGFARRLRVAGQTPAVVYGHGTDPVHFSINELDFRSILRSHGTNAVIALQFEGDDEDTLALVKEITAHPIRPQLVHADFLIVKKGEKVEVPVPVIITGEPEAGLMYVQDANELLLLADALNIPEELVVDVTDANLDSSFLAGSIALPAGAELAADPETLIVSITVPETDPEAEADTEAAEPEDVDAKGGEEESE